VRTSRRVDRASLLGRHLHNERGIALIITLFVVALVTILVLEYHFDATVELDLAVNYSEDTQAYYLALSGLHFARALLQQDDDQADGSDDLWYRLGLVPACFPPQQLLGLAAAAQEDDTLPIGSPLSGLPSTDSITDTETEKEGEGLRNSAEGCVSLRITDESSKLPLNALQPIGDTDDAQPDPDWLNIFERFFESFDIAPETIDAITDWLDANDIPRGIGGAESSYYASLEAPYRTQNGLLHTPGEIRLIRGFDAETIARLFPGMPIEAMADVDMGDNHYLTSYGGAPTVPTGPQGTQVTQGGTTTGTTPPPTATAGEPVAKVNLNTASPEVLQALITGLLGDTGGLETLVDDLITRRQEKQFKNLNEVYEVLTDSALRNRLPKVADVKSTYFRVESVGVIGVIQKKIIAVLKRNQSTLSMVYFRIE
jgi:type II secretory pathway component PulK